MFKLFPRNKLQTQFSNAKQVAYSTTMLVAALSTLTACGGGGDGMAEDPAPTETTFSLAVSDAPVDNASEVVVYFDQVELIGNGDPITFDVTDENGDPRSIDLLTLPGEQFETIVDDTDIPLGEYTQLRLTVTDDSYIVMDDGTYPIRVPSGELKLDGFTAQANFDAAYTVEFDLRKSLVDPVGQPVIMLKPRGVRLVLNDDVGTLKGEVAESLILDTACSVKTDQYAGNAVYVYEGASLDASTLGDDADAGVDDTEVRPFTVAPVTFDEATGVYSYNVGFVPTGDYTVAFTCLAEFDQPETDEDEADGFVLMTADDVTVEAKATATLNIE